MYELLTHRRCGTAFLRGYLEGQAGTFLWHEPSGLIGSDDPTTQLCAVELLVEPPHPEAVRRGEVVETWLDTRTGRLSTLLAGRRRRMDARIPAGRGGQPRCAQARL